MSTINNKVIDQAFKICCDMYNIDKNTLINSKNRSDKIIKPKRLLIYFLYNDLEVKHMRMKKYFKDLHHSTSIYHVNRFEYEIKKHKEVKKQYDLFISEMCRHNIYGLGFYEKRKEIKRLLKEINKITND